MPISVLGLDHISGMHETDLELVLELQSLESAVSYQAFAVFNRQKKKSPLS